VKGVLDKQSQQVDAIDNKAATLFSIGTALFGFGLGIPLGIAGISFGTLIHLPLAWLVGMSYVFIAVLAIRVLRVREYEALDNPKIIREEYWTMPISQFKTEMLLHLEESYKVNMEQIAVKAREVRFLVPAVALEALFLVLFLGLAL